jgi:hypothetical protein
MPAAEAEAAWVERYGIWPQVYRWFPIVVVE